MIAPHQLGKPIIDPGRPDVADLSINCRGMDIWRLGVGTNRNSGNHRVTVVLFAASKEQEGHYWRLLLSLYTVYVQYRTVPDTLPVCLTSHLT